MEGGENHEPPSLCIEVSVPWAVLQLHHGATLQSAKAALDRPFLRQSVFYSEKNKILK